MSTTTISPGDEVTKDPSAERLYQFDWDELLTTGAEIASYTVASPTTPDSALVIDNVALASGNRKVNCRITGGTLRKRYTVMCHIVTNESPTQTEERSIVVRIAQQ